MRETSKYNKEIEESPFGYQLKELIAITQKLRRYGYIILFVLVLTIILLGLYIVLIRQYDQGYKYKNFGDPVHLIFIAYLFGAILTGIAFLFRFSQIKKKGMIVYEELTEEIDWSSKRKEFLHRPSIETRIIIKEFLKSSDYLLLQAPMAKHFTSFCISLFV
jgi:uncharacterized integral membrane protein